MGGGPDIPAQSIFPSGQGALSAGGALPAAAGVNFSKFNLGNFSSQMGLPQQLQQLSQQQPPTTVPATNPMQNQNLVQQQQQAAPKMISPAQLSAPRRTQASPFEAIQRQSSKGLTSATAPGKSQQTLANFRDFVGGLSNIAQSAAALKSAFTKPKKQSGPIVRGSGVPGLPSSPGVSMSPLGQGLGGGGYQAPQNVTLPSFLRG